MLWHLEDGLTSGIACKRSKNEAAINKLPVAMQKYI